MAGSPIATLIAMTAPSPWPTIAVLRRSSSRRERIAPIASRASSIRVKRLEVGPVAAGLTAAARVVAQARHAPGRERLREPLERARRRQARRWGEPGRVAGAVPAAVAAARQPARHEERPRQTALGVAVRQRQRGGERDLARANANLLGAWHRPMVRSPPV